MTDKKIQEQFGQAFIDAMAEFAKKDIKTTAELENDEFSHVQYQDIRKALSETLYGEDGFINLAWHCWRHTKNNMPMLGLR